MRIVIVENDNTKRTREAAAKAAHKLAVHIIRPVEVVVGETAVKVWPDWSEKEAIDLVEGLGDGQNKGRVQQLHALG